MILAEDDYHAIANVATSWTNVGFHSLFDEHRVLILDGEHQGDDGQDNLAGEGARVDPASLGVEVVQLRARSSGSPREPFPVEPVGFSSAPVILLLPVRFSLDYCSALVTISSKHVPLSENPYSQEDGQRGAQ